MPPFFAIYSDELKISPERIQVLIDTYQNRNRTGLIRLAYSSEKRIYLLFHKGQIVNRYSVQPSSKEEISNWQEIISSSGDAYTRVMQLSSFGLQTCKLAIGASEGIQEMMDAIRLRAALSEGWKNQIDPRVYQLSWNAAEGIIFFPSRSQEEYSIFFSPDRLIDQAGISPTFSMWADPVCRVYFYAFDPSSPVWQEHILRLVYSEICNRSFPRFEEITGRAMVDSLIRSLNLQAITQNIDIGIVSYHVMDREIFSSPQEAGRIYQSLLKQMLENVRKVIGLRLAVSFLKEIWTHLQPAEQEVSRFFNILPAEFLD